jgi:hypothetical protein
MNRRGFLALLAPARRGFLALLAPARRGFLALLAPALAVPALLIPRRSFFLPPMGGWPGKGLTSADLQRMKAAMLRAAEMAANPPIVMASEDVLEAFSQRPGAINYSHSVGFEFVTTDRYGRIVPYVMNG